MVRFESSPDDMQPKGMISMYCRGFLSWNPLLYTLPNSSRTETPICSCDVGSRTREETRFCLIYA